VRVLKAKWLQGLSEWLAKKAKQGKDAEAIQWAT
jgi:hypothetical protein